MLRRLLPLPVLLLLSFTAQAQKVKLFGVAGQSNVTVTAGTSSSTKAYRTFPACTVTIYNGGTLTLATTWSDAAGTIPRANPQTSDSTAFWYAFLSTGTYDVKFSGTGVTSPFTITGYTVGIGGGVGVTTWNGRTGAVVPVDDDYTWDQIDKTTSTFADITIRSASDLSSGTLPNARFPATLPAVNGSLLTNLNGSAITSGTIPDARINAVLTGPVGNQTITGAFSLALSSTSSILWPKGQLFGGPNGNNTTSPVTPFIGGPHFYQANIDNESTNATLTANNPDVILNVQGGLANALTNDRRMTGLRVDAHDIFSTIDVDWLQGGQISASWFGSSGKTVGISRGLLLTSYPEGAGNVSGNMWDMANFQNQTDQGNTGLQIEAINVGTGNIGYNRAAIIYSGTVAPSGHITSDDTIFAGISLYGAGSIGTHHTVHLVPLFIDAGTSTVDHNIALMIEDQTLYGGSRNPDPWNMKSMGLTAKNLFAGPIVLGTIAGASITTGGGVPATTPTVGSLYADTDTGGLYKYAGTWGSIDRSPVNGQTGTTYAIQDSDSAKLVTFTNAAAIAVSIGQAGLAFTLTDDFNRADGALGANWGAVSTFTQGVIHSNTFAGAQSSNRAARYIGTAFRLNQSSQATFKQIAARTWVLARVIDPAAGFTLGQTFYFAGSSVADQGNTNYYIGKRLANNDSVLLASATAAAANDVVRLETLGTTTTTLNLYVNGALLLTTTDSSSPITTDGWPGLFVNTSTATIDTFDDFAATGAVTGPTIVFANGWYVDLKASGAGTVTITPTTSTVDGSATKTITTGKSLRLVSNGSNYITIFAN